ncbi:MAG TPA: 16S rRNA (cytosine(1402)-N(4))-methyltransferase RsmH [Geopsychrobacteraceae bacterium]|nr:16S rRNA (cytosine(1402)-N(4))-methyltransferase RsmH [Geopsychrobacteraceae bacterium]
MEDAPFQHLSVMPAEVLEWLKPRAGGIYLDGTLGGGGHARLVLQSAPGIRLIGLDRDPAALQKASDVLADFAEQVSLHHCNFDQAADVLSELGVEALDGMLLDLGVSSHQLDTPERGFSFRYDAPLDMRMNPTVGETAAEVVNLREADELTRIFFQYGEERYARRITRRIVEQRQIKPLTRTGELAELVRSAVPGGRRPSRIHPATRVFQALRIQVNQELEQVETGVSRAIELLKPGGRLVVISFHSLEDRIVKQKFKEQSTGCICPPKLPICQCGHQPKVKILTRKGVRAADAEIEVNARSRSAILRAICRC